MTNFRVGVDIGGTFTDVVFLGTDGTVLAKKIASTPKTTAEPCSMVLREGLLSCLSALMR